MEAHLEKHLTETLKLPGAAVAWLVDLWRVIQLFDDVADGDEIDRADLDRVIWSTLVGMPANEFYASSSATLIPVLATQVLKWQASDQAERAGKADAKSYMWRAGYYDIVLLVVHLCHGQKVAVDAAALTLSLYGETFEEYMVEFQNA